MNNIHINFICGLYLEHAKFDCTVFAALQAWGRTSHVTTHFSTLHSLSQRCRGRRKSEGQQNVHLTQQITLTRTMHQHVRTATLLTNAVHGRS